LGGEASEQARKTGEGLGTSEILSNLAPAI
jgi:hypothetical protein